MPRSMHRFARVKKSAQRSSKRRNFSQFTSHRRTPKDARTRRYARAPGKMMKDERDMQIGIQMRKAILEHNMSQLEQLISLTKGKPDIPDPDDGRTALHLAAIILDEPAVHLLIRSGADVNRQDNKGKTPLHHLFSYFIHFPELRQSIVRIARALIDAHADVNLQSVEHPVDLLSLVSHFNKPELGMMLLEAGATPTIQDEDGNRPLHLHVLAHIKDLGTDEDKADDSLLNALIQAGDINMLNKDGNTPLHLALEHVLDYADDGSAIWMSDDKYRVIATLIQAGARLDLENSDGQTALEILLRFREQGYRWAYDLLSYFGYFVPRSPSTSPPPSPDRLEVKTEFDQMDNDNDMLLRLALLDGNQVSQFRTLLRAGASFVAPDANGESVLELLCNMVEDEHFFPDSDSKLPDYVEAVVKDPRFDRAAHRCLSAEKQQLLQRIVDEVDQDNLDQAQHFEQYAEHLATQSTANRRVDSLPVDVGGTGSSPVDLGADWECPICAETDKNDLVWTVPCGHGPFHNRRGCLLETGTQCPMCRANITSVTTYGKVAFGKRGKTGKTYKTKKSVRKSVKSGKKSVRKTVKKSPRKSVKTGKTYKTKKSGQKTSKKSIRKTGKSKKSKKATK